VRYSAEGKYPAHVGCSFELTQSQKGGTTEPFMVDIAATLGALLKRVRENRAHPEFRLRTTSLSANLSVVTYLTKFPLFGSKFLDFRE